MDAEEKEVIKGVLLDRWISDLRQDRTPTIMSEMEHLTPQEIDETLSLARWMAAVITPITPSVAEASAVAATVLAQIRSETKQHEVLLDVIKQATSFAGLILHARSIRKLRIPEEVERALNLREGIIAGLEYAKTPPHRVPSESLLTLLRVLHVATIDVVPLIRADSVRWAQSAYSQTSTQLGRVDPNLGAEQRYQLLIEATVHDDPQGELAKELQSIEQYCAVVSAQLS